MVVSEQLTRKAGGFYKYATWTMLLTFSPTTFHKIYVCLFEALDESHLTPLDYRYTQFGFSLTSFKVCPRCMQIV